VRGAEECDDGNTNPEDGCSATCETELEIQPPTMSLVVGETRPLQVVNRVTGNVETGTSLVVADPMIAAVEVDPLRVSGLAAGSTTISGGGATATVTVFAGPTLPPGTLRWTAPSDGSGFVSAIPAVPTDNPAAVSDVFTLEASGRVQGLTSDGLVAWTGNAASGVPEFEPDYVQTLPDVGGGLLVLNSIAGSITRLDPVTGQTSWVYSSNPALRDTMAVYPDGTVLFIEGNTVGTPDVFATGLDGNTGATRFRVQLENSSSTSNGFCSGEPSYWEGMGWFSRPVITADGIAHLVHFVAHITGSGDCFEGGNNSTRAIKLLSIDSTGGASIVTLRSSAGVDSYQWNAALQDYEYWASPGLTLDADLPLIAPTSDTARFALKTWTQGYCAHQIGLECVLSIPSTPVEKTLAVLNASGVVSEVPLDPGFVLRDPMVAGQDGVLFAPVTMVADSSPALVAISSGGSVLWTEAGGLEPILAVSEGGVLARQLGGTEQVVAFGVPSNPTFEGLGTGARYSWFGDWYSRVTLPEIGSVIASVVAPALDVADSAWAMGAGNPSGTGKGALRSSQAVRDKVAAVALDKLGSLEWIDDGPTSFCNLFVRDVLTEAKADPPVGAERETWRAILRLDWNYPAVAADWAGRSRVMKCWHVLSAGPDGALPGDVIAETKITQHATGHVGIVVGSELTVSTDSCDETNPGIISQNDFGFRLSPPDECRTIGMKVDAVVRRWKCY
jgi:cysteine-rich repeat protein